MVHLRIVVVLCALALAIGFVKCSSEWIEDNFDDLELVVKPELVLPKEYFRYFLKEPQPTETSPKLTLKYTLGSRIAGDRLIIRYKSPRSDATTAFDVKQSEAYEIEAYITYVEVLVEQSTNDGKITLLSGGTGQKSIGLQTEAGRTLYFNYTTEVYGYF